MFAAHGVLGGAARAGSTRFGEAEDTGALTDALMVPLVLWAPVDRVSLSASSTLAFLRGSPSSGVRDPSLAVNARSESVSRLVSRPSAFVDSCREPETVVSPLLSLASWAGGRYSSKDVSQ